MLKINQNQEVVEQQHLLVMQVATIFAKYNVVMRYHVKTCATLAVAEFGITTLNRVMDVHSADVDSFVLEMEEVVVVDKEKRTLP